jgi:hypothetical protein
VAEEKNESSSRLPDNLLALPLWAAIAAIGLLSTGVVVGFVFLLTPGLDEAERTAGGQVLLIALPALAIGTVILGASWARTERIDAMEKSFLCHTVGKKLETYLVAPKSSNGGATLYPPLFKRIEKFSNSSITSFCYFHLFDDKERRFEILVKSNVFNIEIAYYLNLATSPSGYTAALNEESYDLESLKEWSVVTSANPLLALVAATIHGSIAEGYTVYIQAKPDASGGINVTYRLRQKLQANFLTSPYLRRYFSEDAAIASYYFFAEAFLTAGSTILGGAAGALEVRPDTPTVEMQRLPSS